MNMEPIKMTQEEKLEKAKELYKTANADQRYVLECLFSELRESEDEKIREAIEYAIGQSTHSDGTLINGVSSEKALAWVEEQVKHNNFRNKIQIGDKVTRNEDGVLVNLSQLERVAKKQGSQNLANSAKISKDEQKPAETEKGAKGNEWEIPISAWSEEDEARFESCIKVLQTSDGYDTINAKWLKSLKDRVQPQPKQEWSEEDEEALLRLTSFIENWDKIAKGKKSIQECTLWSCDEYLAERLLNFLNSLSPQNRWKPDGLQLQCLSDAIRDYNKRGYEAPILKELLEQLKKLTE